MSGAINVVLDWRWTFRILGIAGLVVAPVAVPDSEWKTSEGVNR